MFGALDNVTNTSTASKQSIIHEARFGWDLLETAKAASALDHRVRKCASFTVGQDNTASVIKTPKGPRIQGLNACGAHHVCPRCAVTYRGEWTQKVRWLMSQNGKLKRRAYFFTGTVPHNAGDDPGPMITALSAAWNASFSGRSRRQLRSLGFVGYAKALDYTVGGAGHHLHLHALLWFDDELTPEELANLNGGLFGRWSRSVARSLDGRECTRQAFYIEPVDDELAASDYVSKMCGVPMELTSALTKTGKGRTIWGVLRDMTVADVPTELDARIWRQYGAAIKGKRGIELSRDMHALLKGREVEEREAPEVILTLSRPVYRVIREHRLQALLVERIERMPLPWLRALQDALNGVDGLKAWEQTTVVRTALEA